MDQHHIATVLFGGSRLWSEIDGMAAPDPQGRDGRTVGPEARDFMGEMVWTWDINGILLDIIWLVV